MTVVSSPWPARAEMRSEECATRPSEHGEAGSALGKWESFSGLKGLYPVQEAR